MGNKINIAELIKDCPKGMELDCVLFNNVKFEECAGDCIYIRLNNGELFALTKYGNFLEFTISKCVIFPKGKTTWEGFVPPCKFKDGDILYARDEGKEFIFILKHIFEDGQVHCYLSLKGDDLRIQEVWLTDYNTTHRLATEKEKEKLFKAINDNGYKWNEETKTLEKLIEPKFKVGDKVQHKGATSCGSVYEVEKMQWVGNHVEYTIGRLWYNNCRATVTEEDLQPYKEETIEKITIIWQTGEPTISGSYLITIKEDFVTCGNYCTIKGWSHWNDEEITAWCRLRDIEPYKK